MKKSVKKKKSTRTAGSRPAARPTISKREGKKVQKKVSKSAPVMKVKVKVKVAAKPAAVASSKFPKRAPLIGRKLKAAEIREFKQVLLALRDRLSGQIQFLKSDSLKRQDEVNTVEDGTDAFERQFALTIASTENDALFEIEEALRRIVQGNFGLCEVSGEPIEFERLKAIPYTRFSLAAQTELERGKAPYRQSSVMRAL